MRGRPNGLRTHCTCPCVFVCERVHSSYHVSESACFEASVSSHPGAPVDCVHSHQCVKTNLRLHFRLWCNRHGDEHHTHTMWPGQQPFCCNIWKHGQPSGMYINTDRHWHRCKSTLLIVCMLSALYTASEVKALALRQKAMTYLCCRQFVHLNYSNS